METSLKTVHNREISFHLVMIRGVKKYFFQFKSHNKTFEPKKSKLHTI